MALFGKWFGFDHEEIYEEGLAAYDRGDFEEAVEAFGGALVDAGDPSVQRLARFHLIESYAQLGYAAIRRGSPQAASEYFLEALKLAPGYPDLNLGRARALWDLQEVESSLDSLRRALAHNPRFAAAIAFEGYVLYHQGRRDAGLARVAEACDIDASLCQERYRFALECHDRGDFDRAAASLLALSSAVSADANLHARLGDSFARDQRYEEAAREYSSALAIAPFFADVRCKLGHAYLQLGRSHEAVRELSEAVRVNERYAEAHMLLGHSLQALGREEEARAALSRARGYEAADRDFGLGTSQFGLL